MPRTSSRPLRVRAFVFASLLGLLAGAGACGDSSTEPEGIDVALVVGTYDLSVLRFDPQGSLPATDLLGALGQDNVQLILTSGRTAQVVYQDPITDIFTTIAGTFRTTETGVRIDFASNSSYRELLFSRRMEFDLSGTTLTFDAEAPDGVQRARLIELVPAFEGEQLLDPTPGVLRVVFTRTPQG
ncbi:MAG: hypothetical protein RLN75_06135 [Longimicrobiales bacterium]